MNTKSLSDITKIASRIANSTSAKKIFLFGSYANGNPREGSDIDLCIITDDPRRKIDILRDLNRTVAYESDVPLDLLVYSSQEFYDRADSSTSLERTILKNGIELSS